MSEIDGIIERLSRVVPTLRSGNPGPLQAFGEEVWNLAIYVQELESREEKKPKNSSTYRRLTPHAEKALEFLKQYPGLAFSAGALAANIDGMTMEEASSGLNSLYHRNLVSRKAPAKKADAKTGAYSYYFEPEVKPDEV